jgi:hypothetical protein
MLAGQNTGITDAGYNCRSGALIGLEYSNQDDVYVAAL